MPSRSKSQDQQNDKTITDIRIEMGELKTDMKYLKKGQDEQGKLVKQIAENTSNFATETQLLGLEQKIDKRLEGYVTRSEFTPFKATLIFIAASILTVVIGIVVPRLLEGK